MEQTMRMAAGPVASGHTLRGVVPQPPCAHRHARALHARTAGRIAVVALVLASIAVAALSALSHPQPPVPAGWRTVAVETHATLWSLACDHPVEGLSTAETVELIRQENHLASVLYAGQTLRVPVDAGCTTALASR